MPRRVNGPQNREQLQMMVEAIRGEVNLAQDLLNSYEQDLANLEANIAMSENDKLSRRTFLETAINESRDLLNLRQRQLKSIDPTRGGKAAGQARREVWNDTTIESKGMNAIMEERANITAGEKHTQDVEKLKAERQARSEAVRNAAATLATAANKLANEKQTENNKNTDTLITELPDFVEGSNRWAFVDKSESGKVYIYGDPDNQNVRYIYYPEFSEVIKNEIIGNRQLNNVYDLNKKTWIQFPNEYMQKKNWHYDAKEGKWKEYNFEQENSNEQDLENGAWQEPVYDQNGNPVRDQNGNLVFTTKTENEILERKSEEEKARIAKQIESSILGENSENIQKNSENNKYIYRKENVKLNWFQRFKQWFIRLFNKDYQLPAARESGYYLSGKGDNTKLVYKANNRDKNSEKSNDKTLEKYTYRADNNKKTIKGYYFPKVKQLFKDNKRRIMALSAFAVATLGIALGINGLKQHNKSIIEQRAVEAQKQAEQDRQNEERLALAQAEKAQRQQEAMKNINSNRLENHDASMLTTGTVEKQYIATAGLEYTEDSMGRGRKGTISQDTIVEIFNRAIIKENDDGTKQILLSTDGKTWEEYCKDTGMNIEDIQNLLKQDKTYEAGAIMIGGTNRVKLNTYGWVKMSNLKESSKGIENLKNFIITTGNDNTEILQQLQQQEKTGQDGLER